MKKFLQKYRTDFFLWLGLVGGFLVTRLTNLTLIPIFTDEAIYLRWSQIMAHDASLRYLPLVDGKPPFFMWATATLLRVFSGLDPLFVLRLVSVGAGLLALVAIFFASYQLFSSKKVSYLACLFYLLVPFTFFYDRFGLADCLLAMLGLWSLGLSVIVVRKLRLDAALLLGITIGFGLLTKSPALIFYLFPFLLLPFRHFRQPKLSNLLKLGGLLLLVFFVSQVIFSVLRLFPLFHMIAQKNAEFSLSPREFLHQPFAYFLGNFPTLFVWELGYLTPLVFAMTVFGFVVGLIRKPKETLVLFGSFLALLFYLSFFNKSIFPRFLLTLTPTLLILTAYGTTEILKRIHKPLLIYTFCLILLAQPLYTDFKLLTDPPKAPIPDGDANQYMNRWPAGYGVNELRHYFTSESKKYPQITIATEGTFGLMPYALQIYQNEYPGVEVKDYWPLPETPPKSLLEAARSHPTYLVMYQEQSEPPLWHLELVAKYRQGTGNDFLRLFRVLPR